MDPCPDCAHTCSHLRPAHAPAGCLRWGRGCGGRHRRGRWAWTRRASGGRHRGGGRGSVSGIRCGWRRHRQDRGRAGRTPRRCPGGIPRIDLQPVRPAWRCAGCAGGKIAMQPGRGRRLPCCAPCPCRRGFPRQVRRGLVWAAVRTASPGFAVAGCRRCSGRRYGLRHSCTCRQLRRKREREGRQGRGRAAAGEAWRCFRKGVASRLRLLLRPRLRSRPALTWESSGGGLRGCAGRTAASASSGGRRRGRAGCASLVMVAGRARRLSIAPSGRNRAVDTGPYRRDTKTSPVPVPGFRFPGYAQTIQTTQTKHANKPPGLFALSNPHFHSRHRAALSLEPQPSSNPRLRRNASTWFASCPASALLVSKASSGDTGTSYGSLTPVNCGILPARAWA